MLWKVTEHKNINELQLEHNSTYNWQASVTLDGLEKVLN